MGEFRPERDEEREAAHPESRLGLDTDEEAARERSDREAAASLSASLIRTRFDEAQVQAKPASEHRGSKAVDESGSGEGRLPFSGSIQRAFGHHDLSCVQVHVGGTGKNLCDRFGAAALTAGEQVAFSAQPDLHTSAHEAAHVVQQRAGIQLEGGMGKAGDAYEVQADAVADKVVQGRSAEPELDALAGRATSGVSAASSAAAAQPAMIQFQHTWRTLKRGLRKTFRRKKKGKSKAKSSKPLGSKRGSSQKPSAYVPLPLRGKRGSAPEQSASPSQWVEGKPGGAPQESSGAPTQIGGQRQKVEQGDVYQPLQIGAQGDEAVDETAYGSIDLGGLDGDEEEEQVYQQLRFGSQEQGQQQAREVALAPWTVDSAGREIEAALDAHGGVCRPEELQDFIHALGRGADEQLDAEEVLAWGTQTGRFWFEGTNITTRRRALEAYAGMLVNALANGPRKHAQELQLLDDFLGNAPLTANEVFAHGVTRGLFRIAGGMITLGDQLDQVRASAKNAKAQAQKGDRLPAAQGGSGWAVLGMIASEREHDRQENVKQLQGVDQQNVALRLVNGEFVEAYTGKGVVTPDLGGAGVAELWASAPYFATMRLRQVTGDENAQVTKQNMGIVMQICEEIRNNPRLIFVMDSDGQFFAAKAQQNVIHHSSLLSSAPISAAGEIGLQGGKPTYISNYSGHYQPGPAYMWQAVKQLEIQGVNVATVLVQLHGVDTMLTGEEFLTKFDPSAPQGDPRHLSFETEKAVARMNSRLAQQ